ARLNFWGIGSRYPRNDLDHADLLAVVRVLPYNDIPACIYLRDVRSSSFPHVEVDTERTRTDDNAVLVKLLGHNVAVGIIALESVVINNDKMIVRERGHLGVELISGEPVRSVACVSAVNLHLRR